MTRRPTPRLRPYDLQPLKDRIEHQGPGVAWPRLDLAGKPTIRETARTRRPSTRNQPWKHRQTGQPDTPKPNPLQPRSTTRPQKLRRWIQVKVDVANVAATVRDCAVLGSETARGSRAASVQAERWTKRSRAAWSVQHLHELPQPRPATAGHLNPYEQLNLIHSRFEFLC